MKKCGFFLTAKGDGCYQPALEKVQAVAQPDLGKDYAVVLLFLRQVHPTRALVAGR